jgi:probable phosphoglycerate mutase
VSNTIALFQHPFYFVRHGETEMNASRLVAGSVDTALTELGHKQAADAALVLAAQPITGVYSSPLKRARDTAVPIAEHLGLPVVVIPQIAERNWGSLEGQPRGSRARGVTPQGAETTEEFSARVLAGFALIDAQLPLIVGHSGVFRVLCRMLEIGEAEAPVTNALPLKLTPSNGGWKLERV